MAVFRGRDQHGSGFGGFLNWLVYGWQFGNPPAGQPVRRPRPGRRDRPVSILPASESFAPPAPTTLPPLDFPLPGQTRPAPIPNPNRIPGRLPAVLSPAVRVLWRVLGLPAWVLFPSRTADDDTIPEGYPYPEPAPAPKGPPRRPVVRPPTAPAWPEADWWNNPRTRAPPRRWRRPRLRDIFHADPLEDAPWYAPERTTSPTRTPARTTVGQPAARPAAAPRPAVRPWAWPQPLPIPLPLTQPTPTPTTSPSSPFMPSPFVPSSPLPSAPAAPSPLTPLQPWQVPLQQPSGTRECKPCESVKRRRRRKGKCRQGYFREFPDRTEFTTWSHRKCP